MTTMKAKSQGNGGLFPWGLSCISTPVPTEMLGLIGGKEARMVRMYGIETKYIVSIKLPAYIRLLKPHIIEKMRGANVLRKSVFNGVPLRFNDAASITDEHLTIIYTTYELGDTTVLQAFKESALALAKEFLDIYRKELEERIALSADETYEKYRINKVTGKIRFCPWL